MADTKYQMTFIPFGSPSAGRERVDEPELSDAVLKVDTPIGRSWTRLRIAGS